MLKTYEVAIPNRLTVIPEPGILLTRDNARFAYYALKAVREAGQSLPEQDELCDELAALLFPAPASPEPDSLPSREGEMVEYVSHAWTAQAATRGSWLPGVFVMYSGTVADQGLLVRSVTDTIKGLQVNLIRGAAEVRRIPAGVISAARSWIADCEWTNLDGDEDIADLTDPEVVAGVQKYYGGGWPQFRRDGGGQ